MAALTEKDRVKMNQYIRDIADIREDLKLAEKANIPQTDILLKKCDECESKLLDLKKTYFRGKP